jgi:multicomponent Na+:H+ antiporter subunit B
MKKKNDAFSRLLDWLENGDQALDSEMEDTISGQSYAERPRPKKRKKKAEKRKDIQKTQPVAPRRAYADRWWYRLCAAVICFSMIGLLLYAAVRMPEFGSADTLIDSELTEFYVEHTLEETGAVNIVTGIILDYRGFDTLGESHVLFIAVCTVLLMLSIRGERDAESRLRADDHERRYEPEDEVILRSAARILTPLTLVFGLYIILNGHLSPGGGFSGGAVLGAGLILYQNAFGYEKTERFFTYKTFRWVSVCSLLFYSAAKGYHFFTGANHLENIIPLGTPGDIFSAGLLLPLNIAVGCVVACTMYALYTMFRKGEF